MKLPPRKTRIGIRFKITFFMVLLVLVMMGTVTYIFTLRGWDMRVDQMKLRMQHLADNIASIRSLETEDWDVYQVYLDNQIKINPDIIYIVMKDENEQIQASVLNDDWIERDDYRSITDSARISIINQLDRGQITEESRRDMATKSKFIIMGDRNIGMVKVGFSLVDLNNEKVSYLIRNVNLSIVFIFVTMMVSLILSQRIVSPLGKLMSAMLDISRDKLDHEFDIKSKDEIGDMAATFNYMTKRLKEKKVIENFSRELGFAMHHDEIEKMITQWISMGMGAEQGVLFLLDSDEANVFISKNAFPEELSTPIRITADSVLTMSMLKAESPIEFAAVEAMADISGGFAELQIDANSIISPIIINDEILGFFFINTKEDGEPYSEDEKHFFTTLVRQSGFSIENSHLVAELTVRERYKHELEIGRNVQQKLLPDRTPQIAGFDIDGICMPATQVGGDYYDYFILDEDSIGIAIADVSGKSVSAAFYMAVVKGMMTSLVHVAKSPKKLMTELNSRLFKLMERRMFMTMSYGILNKRTGTLTFARAGHNSLLRYESAESRSLSLTPAGIGLGLTDTAKFSKEMTEYVISYQPGDIFLFYTDGITEAMNEADHEFGEDTLLKYLSGCANRSAREMRKEIMRDIRSFTGNAERHDDMTMIILKVSGVC